MSFHTISSQALDEMLKHSEDLENKLVETNKDINLLLVAVGLTLKMSRDGNVCVHCRKTLCEQTCVLWQTLQPVCIATDAYLRKFGK